VVFLGVIPRDLNAYYPSDYHGGLPSLLDLTRAARVIEGYKLEIVRRFVPAGRLLEIGSGLGGFACLAKEAGYEVETIEADETCCSFLSSVIGVSAICTRMPAEVLATGGPYDVIALWHVLEHLLDPLETFALASERLKPGGVMVIATPNPDALQFWLMGRWWAHVDAPRHLFLFPIRVLGERARDHGLSGVMCTTTDEGGLGWNSFGWRQSLANLMQARALRPLADGVGTALSYVAAPFERARLRGATYTLVLQKDPRA
jgi:SAM-dependent methyltransferase